MTDQTPTPGVPAAAEGAHPATREEALRINQEMRYVLYSVFKVTSPLPEDRDQLIAETQAFLDSLRRKGLPCAVSMTSAACAPRLT